jgi:hypothetical protein
VTAREPSAVEVIAEAHHAFHHDQTCPTGCAGVDEVDEAFAEAVLAAIRAMTVEQQAEVIGGEVERGYRFGSGTYTERPAGPWREVQP